MPSRWPTLHIHMGSHPWVASTPEDLTREWDRLIAGDDPIPGDIVPGQEFTIGDAYALSTGDDTQGPGHHVGDAAAHPDGLLPSSHCGTLQCGLRRSRNNGLSALPDGTRGRATMMLSGGTCWVLAGWPNSRPRGPSDCQSVLRPKGAPKTDSAAAYKYWRPFMSSPPNSAVSASQAGLYSKHLGCFVLFACTGS